MIKGNSLVTGELTFDTYQERIADFAVYPEKGTGSKMELAYLALGLTGEAGEVSEKIKKFIRDGGVLDEASVIKELGDVLWYLTRLANTLCHDLYDVASMNIQKLQDRQARNVLAGSGDER